MRIVIKIDTKPKGCEYLKAGTVVDVTEAEGTRLCMLGFAEEVKTPKKSKTAKTK